MSALPVFAVGGHVRTLAVVRSARARRMRLAVDPRDGTVRLTLPPRAALGRALLWAEGHRPWIEASLATLPCPRPFVPGATLPLEGVPVTIDWHPDHSRTIRHEDGRLLVGGPGGSLAPRVTRWLRSRALSRLTDRTGHYAALAGVTVGRIGIGDPRGRWGSCAANGDIRYSWRLILAPPDILSATVAHEVAHRLHMDHSRAFHDAVTRLFGRAPTAERAWLKAHGAGLHWVGRTAADG